MGKLELLELLEHCCISTFCWYISDYDQDGMTLSGPVCEETRKQKVLDAKVKKMFREMFFHSVYLILLLVICYGNLDKDNYFQARDMRNLVSYPNKVRNDGMVVINMYMLVCRTMCVHLSNICRKGTVIPGLCADRVEGVWAGQIDIGRSFPVME